MYSSIFNMFGKGIKSLCGFLFNFKKSDQCFSVLFTAAFCFDLILYVHSTIFQLCGTGLPGLNQY